jgi:PBSX family phage terminase large subunit
MTPFTEKQLEVIRYNNLNQPRITILEGAIRSGKTHANNILFALHVSNFKGKKFVMTGTSMASLKRNVLDDLSNYFDIDTTLNQNNEFKMLGNTVACFGSDKIDSYKTMKGFTAYGWYANEVSEHHINTIDQAFKRCSGAGSRIFWDTNPSSPNHMVKVNYIDRDGQKLDDGKEHIKTWHFTLDDNTFLDPAFKDSIKKSTPPGMWYDRDILGLWVSAEGMIYKMFDQNVHVVTEAPKDQREYFAGVDWGFEHIGVVGLYSVDGDGNVCRLLEIAEREKSIEWWTNACLGLSKQYKNVSFYADPARPDNISALRNAGLYVFTADNPVVEGISFVAGLLTKKQLTIVRDTNRTYLKQIYNYRWKQGVIKEEPVKDDDDCMDSERYALYSHLGKSRNIQASISIHR